MLIRQLFRNTSVDQILRRPPLLYRAQRRSLVAFDRMDLAERQKLLEKLSGQTLSHFQDYVANGQPLTTKADVRNHPELYYCPGAIQVSAETGGSTGVPLRLRRSVSQIAYEQATIDHVAGKLGFPLERLRTAVLRGDTLKNPNDHEPPFWKMAGNRRALLSAPHLNRDTLRYYLEFLNDFRPDVIACHPSSLQLLAQLLHQEGAVFRPALAMTSSEYLPRGLRRYVADVLKCPLLDYYGQSERVAFAWSIEEDVYWFRGDYSLVELIPRADRLRIVGTTFRNSAMRLVRYDTEDHAEVAPGADLASVALGLESFPGIAGREAEFIELPDGGRVIGLCQIPRGITGALSVQLIQTEFSHVRLHVVPTSDWNEEQEQALIRNFRTKVPSSVSVDVIMAEQPARLPSGKAPLFLRDDF